jgi:hypothetical protein
MMRATRMRATRKTRVIINECLAIALELHTCCYLFFLSQRSTLQYVDCPLCGRESRIFFCVLTPFGSILMFNCFPLFGGLTSLVRLHSPESAYTLSSLCSIALHNFIMKFGWLSVVLDNMLRSSANSTYVFASHTVVQSFPFDRNRMTIYRRSE